MSHTVSYLTQSAAPVDRPCETIDARELPPPQPLKNTLEQLTDIGDSVILVQLNDRRPQHLYPKLEDRGYQYETLKDGDTVVTIIWQG
jgi:uncharacterized protein (DUF2249 family)